MKNHIVLATLAALACLAQQESAQAQQVASPRESRLDAVQITATRFGEQVQEVPLSMSVVSGEELRARGASDLRAALALLGGVKVAPGGDAGPAGAVPGLLGLREVDDFLLLIDGIPAGGAFIPQFEMISLHNVERIEVLRGAAPVYFGTTAFAGTVNVIHYPAGQADSNVTLSYGSYGSVSASGAAVLSDAALKQSISGEISSDKFSDPRAGFKRAVGSYRMATELAGGRVRLDFNTTLLRQKPGSPTPIDDSGQLSADLPADFNQNPADARLDTNRYQLALGYERVMSLGQWGTTLSITRSQIASTRGFLIDGYRDAIGDNAVGAVQSRRLTDVFFDTHLTDKPAPWLSLTYGLNELYGRAAQSSSSFTYKVPLDGSAPPDSAAGTVTDTGSLRDTRSFFGLYVQSRLLVSRRASLLAGLRWNRTNEARSASDADASLSQTQHNSRWSGSLGGQLKVWSDESGDLDDVTLHASLGNTFQPPQIDFGPDAGLAPLLKPETQRSLEFGIKADGLDGRLDVDLSAFLVDFANQAVSTRIAGNPALSNAGSERFKGVEIETSYRVRPALTIAGHASYNDARYVDFSTLLNGAMTQLAGNSLALAPKLLAGGGIVYAPLHGWRASLTASHTGKRYLDMLNTAAVGGYTTVDASMGYGFNRCIVSLNTSNLGNRRDAVLASELGEGQIYRMPGRRVTLSMVMSLK